MRKHDFVRKGPGVTEVRMLSDWFPGIKGGRGDTEVYVLDSGKPGGSALVLGGTHANEPAGFLTAIVLVENARPEAGKLFVIPFANASAFTHTDYMEGEPRRFTIEGASGARTFRFGSRATSPADQWPDPDIYIHASSGQKLSGSETRNLNRAYPGRPDGTFTEKVAFAITSLIKAEKVDVSVDLHEASPEYPVINAIVAHERAMKVASIAVLNLEFDGITIGLEPSPQKLRGLSHRELGDATDTFALLMETANPSQGRLRGVTDEALILKGRDPLYLKAKALGRLFVPFDEKGSPVEARVGRHLAGLAAIFSAYTEEKPDRAILFSGLPSYDELQATGLGKLF
ncbi:MAG: succinylglutamate desuccinylase/aspartoacylase family protein [Spirochaetaceae bacterium]|nr:succinylglutamate desuccinylase/aspartoacylase family protein [Spirochaetaceae bacterium]